MISPTAPKQRGDDGMAGIASLLVPPSLLPLITEDRDPPGELDFDPGRGPDPVPATG